jgi:hypothetical protein
MRRHLGLACAVLALSPISAYASPWSQPVQLSSEAGSRPDVAVNPRGDAVVAWNGAGIKGIWFSDRPAGALFSLPRRVADGSAPHVAVNKDGVEALAWSEGASGVRASIGAVGGGLGSAETVSGPEHPAGTGWSPLDVAINDRGDVLVTWGEPVPSSREGYPPEEQLILAAWRPAGGAFGAPQVLGKYGLAGSIQATLDDAGRGVIAWDSADQAWQPPPDSPPVRVYVAEGPLGGGFATPFAISGPGPNDSADGGFGLAANPRGDVLVAWAVAGLSGGPDTVLPRGLHVASRPAGGAFGRDQLIATNAPVQYLPLTRPAVSIGPLGGAAVSAYTPCDVTAITRAPGRAWGPLHETWHDCDSSLAGPTVDLDSAGRAVVAAGGGRGDGRTAPLRSARVSNGHAEAPLTVSPPRSQNFDPLIALDGVGNGVLVWEGDGGRDPDKHGLGFTRPIQLSVYDGSPPWVSGFGVDGSAAAFKYRLSEPARVTVSVARERHGTVRHLATLRARALRGRHLLHWSGDLLRELRNGGRYRATISARDSADKRARARQLTFGP